MRDLVGYVFVGVDLLFLCVGHPFILFALLTPAFADGVSPPILLVAVAVRWLGVQCDDVHTFCWYGPVCSLVSCRNHATSSTTWCQPLLLSARDHLLGCWCEECDHYLDVQDEPWRLQHPKQCSNWNSTKQPKVSPWWTRDVGQVSKCM